MKTVTTRYACFAGGCFWCITQPFCETPGVLEVIAGYAGGEEPDPAYEDVKAQKTGHRESVRIAYDPASVSYETLVGILLSNIDPFDGGGQFIDRGHSYTTAVYYADESEKNAAEAQLRKLAESEGRTPCVSVEPFVSFYPAEESHQMYFEKNPDAFAREMEESGRAERRTGKGGKP